MSNKAFHQTLCVELVYSQSGLLRGAPPWARPRWRSRWSSVASRRGRRAAGWRWCRWRLKAAGSGPPGGRTFLYNTWLKLLFSFTWLLCGSDSPLKRKSVKSAGNQKEEVNERERESGRERERGDHLWRLTPRNSNTSSDRYSGEQRGNKGQMLTWVLPISDVRAGRLLTRLR